MSWEQSLREEYMEYKNYRCKIDAAYAKLHKHFTMFGHMVVDEALHYQYKITHQYMKPTTVEPVCETTTTGTQVCLYIKTLGEELLAVDLKCAEYMAEAEAFKIRYYEMSEQNARLEEANSKLMEELVRLQEHPR